MSRRLLPHNQALQDRIAAVLCDAWPELLNSAQVAERVGGTRTLWEVCSKPDPRMAGLRARYPDRSWCRAEDGNRRFPATHHDGPVPQDSWEVPWDAMTVNPPLNRLARDGVIEKVKVDALRTVLWRAVGGRADDVLAALEASWEASS